MTKKALVVGLDYPYSPRLRLRAARRDARNVARFLRTQGFDVLLLTDGFFRRRTKREITNKLQGYAREIMSSFVFYFSGHGVQVPAPPGSYEERDGRDEALVCGQAMFAPTLEILLDDEIKQYLVRISKNTRKISVLVDACHSGTVVDLGVMRTPDARIVRTGPVGGQPILSISSSRDDEFALEQGGEGLVTASFLRHTHMVRGRATDLCSAINQDLERQGQTQRVVLSADAPFLMYGPFME